MSEMSSYKQTDFGLIGLNTKIGKKYMKVQKFGIAQGYSSDPDQNKHRIFSSSFGPLSHPMLFNIVLRKMQNTFCCRQNPLYVSTFEKSHIL